MELLLNQRKKRKVYLPHDKLIWIRADVLIGLSGGDYDVQVTDEDFILSPERKSEKIELTQQIDQLPIQNENLSSKGVEDMCLLDYLHEASILDNLRLRFKNLLPYTYTGDIIIAVNPYRWLDIYTDEIKDKYLEKLRHEIEPHAYTTSASAYRGLRDFGRNQSILVSGESGAGKTETVKIMLGHIAHISGKKSDSTIQKVLQANPLLESFGNAKTARNDNSSRFGKFLQLQFDGYSKLVGSRSITYLLEKSRVVSQNELERNFHIFHQLFAAPMEVKAAIFLQGKSAADFAYTNKGIVSDTTTIEGVSDGDKFLRTLSSLELIGINVGQQREMHKVLSGILHLGQVHFTGDADKSSVDPTVKAALTVCCELLGLSEEEFSQSTTTRRIEVEGSVMRVNLSKEKATDGRDALAKDIYERLFGWLVTVINHSTAVDEFSGASDRTMSLLDIFGFECFKVNRFEQLCINFANEKLQQKFTADVFLAVQEEYKSEGLSWDAIGYRDNREVLDLLEGRRGILAFLNEECIMPRGNDKSFLSKLVGAFSKTAVFGADKYGEQFLIRHYVGEVSYTVDGFIDRNKDALPSECKALMRSSELWLLQTIYGDPVRHFSSTGSEVSLVDSTVSGSDVASDVGAGAGADLWRPSKGESVSLRRVGSQSGLPRNGSAGHSTSGTPPGPNFTSSSPAPAKASRRQSFVNAETVTTKFRAELDQLMKEISRTDVHYVRCIKPNGVKSSEIFDRPMVVEHLRCAGLIEAVTVSRAAYPYRLTHENIVERFGELRPKAWYHRHRAVTTAEKCAVLLKDFFAGDATKAAAVAAVASSSRLSLYEVGRTKVFFSASALEKLEETRGRIIFKHIGCIQRIVRGCLKRKAYQRAKKAIVKLQAFGRRVTARCTYLRRIFAIRAEILRQQQDLAIVQIQKICRSMLAKRRVKRIRQIILGKLADRMAKKKKSFSRPSQKMEADNSMEIRHRRESRYESGAGRSGYAASSVADSRAGQSAVGSRVGSAVGSAAGSASIGGKGAPAAGSAKAKNSRRPSDADDYMNFDHTGFIFATTPPSEASDWNCTPCKIS